MPKIVVRPTQAYTLRGELVRVTFVLARNAEGDIYLKRRR